VEIEDELPLLAAAGVEPDELVAEVTAGEEAQREMAARLFGAWVDEVVNHQSSVSGRTEGDDSTLGN
jgi:hypothetical protein